MVSTEDIYYWYQLFLPAIVPVYIIFQFQSTSNTSEYILQKNRKKFICNTFKKDFTIAIPQIHQARCLNK